MDTALGVKVLVRRCSDKSQLPVITTPGGNHHVISEADCEYEVVVQTTSRLPRVTAPYSLGVHLKIDGQRVGYCKHVRVPDTTVVFEGFCVSASSSCASGYRRFKFTRADQSQDRGPEVTDPEQIQAGRITVTITKDRVIAARHGPPTSVPDMSSSGGAAMGHLPEGKKFFLAPSLMTGGGKLDMKQTRWSKVAHEKVETLGTIELRYETASTLMLRKHLDKANPQHKALLRSSRDPTIRALLGDSDDNEDHGSSKRKRRRAAAAAAGVGSSAIGVKRDRNSAEAAGASAGAGAAGAGGGARVKPEPGTRVKPEPGTGGSTVFLDLTKPPEMPLKVEGHVVGTDEVAVCDLADSDDEGAAGPRWEVHKKQAVEVEETEAT